MYFMDKFKLDISTVEKSIDMTFAINDRTPNRSKLCKSVTSRVTTIVTEFTKVGDRNSCGNDHFLLTWHFNTVDTSMY